MKVPFSVLVALGGCLLGTPTAGAIELRLLPASPSVSIGQTVNLAIAISGLGANSAPSLGAFSFDVTFPNTLLAYQSTTFGDQLSLNGITPTLQLATDRGISIFLEESSGNSIVELNNLQAADFTLATLTFRAIGPGTSFLDFANVTLGDAGGDPLVAALFGGAIVIPPTIPEPSLVPVLLLLVSIGVSVALSGENRSR